MPARARKQTQDETNQSNNARELRRGFGIWLKEKRERKGLTQADLGHELGLKYYSFISQVENGLGRIPQELYARWADGIGVEKEEFAWVALSRLEPGLYELLQPQTPAKETCPA